MDFIYGLVGGSLLLGLLRPYWGALYTNDPDIDALVYRTLPIMFLYQVVDSSKCITLNVLRSTGRPFITVLGNVVGEDSRCFCFVAKDICLFLLSS